jgi:hypothetical protein
VFFTVIMTAAQEDDFPALSLNIVHTLASFNEDAILTLVNSKEHDAIAKAE